MGAISGSSTIVNNATVVVSRANTFTYAGMISGTGSIEQAGIGTTLLSGANAYSGGTTVFSGTLIAANTTGSATGTGAVTVASGGTLGGTGAIGGAVTISNGAMLSPGVGAAAGMLTINNSLSLTPGSLVSIAINGPAAGTDYGQVAVNGAVSLGGSVISLTLGYAPAPGESFVVINNDGVDAISGTFAGFPEGSLIDGSFGGTTYEFSISYAGGTGNDVVLTCVAPKVLHVSSGTPNGTYGTGQNIQVGVKFSKPVMVSGNPEISLETGAIDRVAIYQSGSGSDSLSFTYVVVSGDTTPHLDYMSTTSLDSSGGSMHGTGGVAADLTLPAPGATGSLGYGRSIVIDAAAPVAGTMTIASDHGFTSDIDPAITFAGVAGADSVRFGVNDTVTMGAWMKLTPPDSVNLGTEGGKRVWAQFKDLAGNLSIKISDSTTYDATAPGVGSMAIAGNGGFTNDFHPAISFTGVSGADSARYGVNDSAALSAWRKYASPDSVNLGTTGGKRVWAQFKDFAGNLSAKISDSTFLDTTKPLLTLSSTAPDPTNVSPIHVTASWSKSVTDFVSGDLILANAAVSNFTGSGSNYGFDLLPAGQGTVAVDVTAGAARDTANNLSPATVQFKRTYDTQGPTIGTMSIKSNGGFTNDADPRITFSGVGGADSARFGVNDSVAMGVWKVYASIDSVTMGPQGGKRVWAQFKDLAGNVSVKISDSVTYDITPPTAGAMSITDDHGYTNDVDPKISFTGVSGADSVRYGVNDSVNFGAWRAYMPVDSTNIGPPGSKRIYAQFGDRAGNRSIAISAATVYDMTSPVVGSMSIKKTNGYTRDPDPAIIFTGVTGADSVRYGVNDSLAMGPWRAYAATDSIALGAQGGKRVWAQFRDLAGNQSARISDSVAYDTTAPQNVTALTSLMAPLDRIALQWVSSTSPDVDSIMIRFNVGTYPTDTGNGTFWKKYGKAATMDTITGIAEKTTYYVGLFVKDYAGNWCAAAGGARAMIYAPDMIL